MMQQLIGCLPFLKCKILLQVRWLVKLELFYGLASHSGETENFLTKKALPMHVKSLPCKH